MADQFSVVGMGDLVTDVLLAIDYFPIQASQGQDFSKMDIQPGGIGNFLIAGARLGMKMIPMGLLSQDYFSSVALSIFQAERIDVSNIILLQDQPPQICLVLTGKGGEHVFLSSPGLPIGPQPLSAPWKTVLDDADALLAEGYTLNEPFLCEALLEAMAFCRQNRTLVFFDPGPKICCVPPEIVARALAVSDALILTLDEARLLLGEQAELNDAKAFLTRGPKVVCVKCGKDGCHLFTSAEIIQSSGYAVDVRDTTAAGDSFNAAFIYGYLHGWPLEKIGAFSNAMGAVKVTKFGGGQNVPTVDELREFIRSHGIDVEL